jgi:O-acetyl-ADP-ribose deacetylase (regulator of RNase III)
MPSARSDCYRNSLRIAAERGLKTMAFPAISTGVYRFPPERACRIAVDTVREFLIGHPAIEKVSFVCFDTLTFGLYKEMVA